MYFPNTNELFEAIKKLSLVIREKLDGSRVSVNYIELTKMTSTFLINAIETDGIRINPSEQVTSIYKDGCDTTKS